MLPRRFLCKPVDLGGVAPSTWQESLKQSLDYGESVGMTPHPLASGWDIVGLKLQSAFNFYFWLRWEGLKEENGERETLIKGV